MLCGRRHSCILCSFIHQTAGLQPAQHPAPAPLACRLHSCGFMPRSMTTSFRTTNSSKQAATAGRSAVDASPLPRMMRHCGATGEQRWAGVGKAGPGQACSSSGGGVSQGAHVEGESPSSPFKKQPQDKFDGKLAKLQRPVQVGWCPACLIPLRESKEMFSPPASRSAATQHTQHARPPTPPQARAPAAGGAASAARPAPVPSPPPALPPCG